MLEVLVWILIFGVLAWCVWLVIETATSKRMEADEPVCMACEGAGQIRSWSTEREDVVCAFCAGTGHVQRSSRPKGSRRGNGRTTRH